MITLNRRGSLFACPAFLVALLGMALPVQAQFPTTPTAPRNQPTISIGQFKVVVGQNFTALMNGYPGYDGPSRRLTSPVLLDPATIIGESAVHTHGSPADLPPGTPTGVPGVLVSDADFTLVPPSFQATNNGTREIHTRIVTFTLIPAHFPVMCFGLPVGPTVRAGAAAPLQPMSPGEVESHCQPAGCVPGPGTDFPAQSFFNIFVEVDIPGVGPTPPFTLYNTMPLLVVNNAVTTLPPTAVYIHENSNAVPVYFRTPDPASPPNPPRWAPGDLFGMLVLAGHMPLGNGPPAPDCQTVATLQTAMDTKGEMRLRFRFPGVSETINTPANESSPTLTGIQRAMWFVSDRSGGLGGLDVWTTTRPNVSAPWAPPTPEAGLNSASREHSVAVRSDGNEIIVASNRPGVGATDLYRATRAGPGPWSALALIQGLNTPGIEEDPSLTTDGLEIFFTSDRPTSLGGGAIWRSTRASLGAPWGPPVRVAELDTPGLESSPSISDDGLFFFFGSTRPGGVGQSDWYVATRPNRNAPFGRASNVSEMNSIRAEFNGTITRDCFSFYSSATPAGAATSDILRFDGVLPETSATAAQVGQPWTIRCRRDAGDFAFIFLALYETTGISLQGVQGRLFLGLPPVPLLLGVGILDQDGVFPLTVLVPADPVLVGITLFTQTVAQDSAAAIYLSRTHRAVTIQP